MTAGRTVLYSNVTTVKEFKTIEYKHTLTARNIRAGIVVHPAQLNRISCEAGIK